MGSGYIPVCEAKFCLQLVLPPLNLRQNVEDAVTRRCRHAECHATERNTNLTSYTVDDPNDRQPVPHPLPTHSKHSLVDRGWEF
jgi:hypothetical protein